VEEVVMYFSDAHLHREEARRPITRPLRLSSPACRGRYLASPMTAGLVGTNGFVAIPTTAIDLPLVQRLRRSPRFWVRVPITSREPIAASSGGDIDEKAQLSATVAATNL
jgi:hypothetical protein